MGRGLGQERVEWSLSFHSARSADSSKLTCTQFVWRQDLTRHFSTHTKVWALADGQFMEGARHKHLQQLQWTQDAGANSSIESVPTVGARCWSLIDWVSKTACLRLLPCNFRTP